MITDTELEEWAKRQIADAEIKSKQVGKSKRNAWFRELTYGKAFRFQAAPCVKIFGDALLKELESR